MLFIGFRMIFHYVFYMLNQRISQSMLTSNLAHYYALYWFSYDFSLLCVNWFFFSFLELKKIVDSCVTCVS